MKNKEESDLIIDGALLSNILKQRARYWAITGPLACGALLLLGLCLLPQSFSSTVSIAVQQPASGGSALSLLSGQSPSKRYIGIIKSRWAAEAVENTIHLRRLYRLPSNEDAVRMLMASVRPEDNAAEGLFYVGVTLKGPPRIAPHAAARRAQIRRAAAQAAEAYGSALRTYYETSDNERDSVLLRGAAAELHRAQADFDAASARLNDFAKHLKTVNPRLAPDPAEASSLPGNAVGAAAAGGTALEKLYGALAQVQIEIQSDQAALETRRRMVADQLKNPLDIPSEDPLLTSARNRVSQDKAEVSNLEIQFGPDNPRLVMARGQLQIDSAILQKQSEGVQHNLTTAQVGAQAQLERLRAQQTTLQHRIAEAESRLPARRALSSELARLQAEAALRFEVLKTTMAEAAKVRVENVSAQSRMSIVDDAVPAQTGQPSLLQLAAISLCLILLGFGISVVRAYLVQAQQLGTRETGEPEAAATPLIKPAPRDAHLQNGEVRSPAVHAAETNTP